MPSSSKSPNKRGAGSNKLPQIKEAAAEEEKDGEEDDDNNDDNMNVDDGVHRNQLLRETTAKLNRLTVDYARLQESKLDTEDQLEEARHDLQTADRLIQDLKRARDEAVTQRQETGKKLRKLRVENADLRGTTRALHQDLRDANDDVQQLQTKVGKMQYQKDDAQGELEKVELKHRADVEARNQQIKNLQKENEKALEDLQETMDALERLQSNHDQLRRDNDSQKRQMAEMQQDLAKLRFANASVQGELEDVLNHAAALEKENAELQNDRAGRDQELLEERQRAQSTIRALQKELDASRNASGRNDHQLQEALDKIGKLEARRKLQKYMGAAIATTRDTNKSKIKAPVAAPAPASSNQPATNSKVSLPASSPPPPPPPPPPLPSNEPTTKRRSRPDHDNFEEEKKETDFLLDELAKAKTETARVEGELAMVLEHDLAELKAAHSSMMGGLQGASKDLGALEAGIRVAKNLQRQFEDMEAANQAQADANESLVRERQFLQDQLHNATKENDKLTEELAKSREYGASSEPLKGELALTRQEKDKALRSNESLTTKLRESKDIRRKLEPMIESIRSEISHLEKDLGDAQNERKASEEKCALLQNKQAELTQLLKSERGKWQDDVARLEEELETAKYSLKKSDDVVQRYGGTIKQLEEDLAKIREENGSLERRRAEMEGKNAREVEALRSDRTDLKDKLDKMGFELKESQYALKKSDGLVDRHVRRIKQLEADLAEIRDAHEALERKNREAERRNAEESKKLQSEHASLKRIKAELESSKESNEKAENLVRAHGRRISELEDELSNVQKETQKETEKASNRTTEQESGFADQIKALKKERDDRIEALTKERDELKARLEGITEQLDEMRKAAAANEASFMQQLTVLQTSTSETEQEIRQAIEELKQDLASSDQEKEDARRVGEILGKDLEEARKMISNLSRNNQDLSQQRGVQNGELEKLGRELGCLRRENDVLNGRVSNLESSGGDYGQLREARQFERFGDDYGQARGARQVERFGDDYGQVREAGQFATMTSRGPPRQDTTQLARQLDKRYAEVESLRKKVNKRTEELQKLQAEHRELNKAHKGVVKASRDAAVALSRQLDERNCEIDSLKSKWRIANNENLDTKEKLRKLVNENEKCEMSLREARRKLNDAMADANSLQADRDRRLVELQEVSIARDSLQDSVKAAEALSERLRRQHSCEIQAQNEKIEGLTKAVLLAEKEARENGRRFEEAKAALREATLEKRSQSEAHAKETDCLKRRISLLEARFDGSRQAYSEVSARKDDLNRQLKSTEVALASTREAAASLKNHAKSKDLQSQIAYQRLLEKVEKLEDNLSSLLLEREKLEQELSSVVAERDGLSNELFHARGKLRESLSTIASLESSFEQAEGNLADLIRSLAEVLQAISGGGDVLGSQRDAGHLSSGEPVDLIEKLKVVMGSAIESRDNAVSAGKALETALDESRALSDSLKQTIQDRDNLVTDLRNAFKAEKEDLMAEMLELERIVEHVENEKNDLVHEMSSQLESAQDEAEMLRTKLYSAQDEAEMLRSKLDSAQDEAETFRTKLDSADNEAEMLKTKLDSDQDEIEKLKKDLENSNTSQEALCATNASLEKSLDQATGAATKLEEEKSKLQEIANNDRTALRQDNECLQKSLDDAMVAIGNLKQMQRGPKEKDDSEAPSAKRAIALEHALADKERKLKDAFDQMRLLDDQNQVFHSDAVKLKVFLEDALEEAKLLLGMLREVMLRLDPKSAIPSAGKRLDSTMNVFTRLEDIVKNIATEVDGLDQPSRHRQNEGPAEVMSRNSTENYEEDIISDRAEKRRKTATHENQKESNRTGTVDREKTKQADDYPNSPARAPERFSAASERLREDFRYSPSKTDHDTLSEIEEQLQQNRLKTQAGAQNWRTQSGFKPFSQRVPQLRFPTRTASNRNPYQDAYVQQRLAQSAAAPKPAGILKHHYGSNRPSYQNSPPAGAGHRAISDPEVFNSPFLNNTQPKRTRLVTIRDPGQSRNLYTTKPASSGRAVDKNYDENPEIQQFRTAKQTSSLPTNFEDDDKASFYDLVRDTESRLDTVRWASLALA